MEVYETKNLTRHFLFRKETRNLYWNRILPGKMKDYHGDYVFILSNEWDEWERERTSGASGTGGTRGTSGTVGTSGTSGTGGTSGTEETGGDETHKK